MNQRISLPLAGSSPIAPRPIFPVAEQPDYSPALVDSFGRIHNNLRISVTDRCNLRCTYCMPEDVSFVDRSELLSFEEITRFVRVIAPMGVDKVRLTGGEPLMRRGMPKLVRMLTEIPGLRDLGMTTNGLLLARQAKALYDAGLRRLNVSLDTLDALRFRTIVRRDGLDKVLQGLETAARVGFEPIKVNAVLIRGINDIDCVPLARYAREHGFEMRFIEYMPIGAEQWEREKVYFAAEILDKLQEAFGPLQPAPDQDPRAPALEFDYIDGSGRIGIIASVSRPFCRTCNRIRLTAEGKLRNCLFALNEADVRPYLRGEVDEASLAAVIRGNVHTKWEGHEINTARFVKPPRTMHSIGG